MLANRTESRLQPVFTPQPAEAGTPYLSGTRADANEGPSGVFKYFTDDMWLKTSLQHRNTGIHNVSVIYGWQIRKRTNWYVVFSDVDRGAGSEKSVFAKVTFTFRAVLKIIIIRRDFPKSPRLP